MATSQIKVLALDLDGTLTNDEKKITPRTRAALQAAVAQGVTLVLASGRPTGGVAPRMHPVLQRRCDPGLPQRTGPLPETAGPGAGAPAV